MKFLKGLSGICSINNDVCTITVALYHHAMMPISIFFFFFNGFDLKLFIQL